MEQVLFGGHYDALNSSTTEYNILAGGRSWFSETYIFNESACISSAGTISNLSVELSAAPGDGEGDAYTFTLMLGNAGNSYVPTATTLTCTITQPATSASDTEHEVTVTPGDIVCIRCEPINTPSAAPYAQWVTKFTGSTSKESLLLSSVTSYNSGTYYAAIHGAYSAGNSEDYRHWQIIPTSGKIKNLYVRLQYDPGNSPDAYSYTLMLGNAGNSYVPAATALTCTVTANDKSGHDTDHEVTVAAGDIVYVRIVPLESPLLTTYTQLGFTFVADTDGESLILGGYGYNVSTSATYYFPPLTSMSSYTSTENQRQQLALGCTIKNLYIRLSGTPYNNSATDDKYTFTLRKNADVTTLTCEVVGNNVTGSDTTHEVEISNSDNLELQCVPSSTPTARMAYWGMVCYIEPAGAALLKIINETLGIVEAGGIVRRKHTRKIISETVNVNEALSRRKSILKLIAETVNVNEAINKAMEIAKVISETVNINEVIGMPKAIIRVISEVINVSESINRLKSIRKIVNETVNVSEAVSRFKSLLLIINETVNINEVINKARGIAKTVSETVNVSEAINKARTIAKTVSETININETINRARALAKTINETVNVNESIGRVKSILKVISETVNVNEATNKLKNIRQVISETVNVNESLARFKTIRQIISETVNINETIIKAKAITKVISETVNINESSRIARTMTKVINETVGIVEVIVNSAVFEMVAMTVRRMSTAFTVRAQSTAFTVWAMLQDFTTRVQTNAMTVWKMVKDFTVRSN